jgi:hypothetical protein
MKTPIRISVVLNALLLGWLVLLWQNNRTATMSAPAAPAMVAKIQPQLPPPSVPSAVQTVVKTVPFHWSQLESTNGYLLFVANLRAAGCPEATVEDIVRGDTARAYGVMRHQLGVSSNEPGRWSEQAQEQMAAYFLGQTPNAAGIAEGSVAAGPNNQATDNAQTESATLAAFLQDVDFTAPGMSAEQQQEIAGQRQALLAQISAAGQIPNSPARTSSTSGSDNTASSQTSGDNLQTSGNNSQTTQSEINEQFLLNHQASPAMLQAEEEESIVGGLFGIGAAMQYDQYQASQQKQQ